MSSELQQQGATAPRKSDASNLPAFVDFAGTFGVNPGNVMALMAKTVISVRSDEPPPTAEEIVACAIVCNTHQLNPFLKEIHFFRSKGKMLFVVGVDGWSKIAQRQPQMNGVEWEMHNNDKGEMFAMTCKIYRKDWALPIVITEYLDECYQDKSPAWQKSKKRMMRNRSFGQCVRIAFAIAGLTDETDADQMTDGKFSSQVIEAGESVDPRDMELLEYATKAGYNKARLLTLQEQYKDRPDELLTFLKQQAERNSPRPSAPRTAAKSTKAAPPKTVEAEPADESQEGPSEGAGFDFNPDLASTSAASGEESEEDDTANVENF